MNRYDPNGPRRDFGVRAGRQADERGGFGAPRQDPSLRYEPENDPGIHFRGGDPEHGADEEGDLAGEGTARRRRGEKEVSPYPRHHVAALGGEERILPVDGNGILDLGALDATLAEQPACVSVMWVNNEVGTLQPVGKIAERCRDAGVIYRGRIAL